MSIRFDDRNGRWDEDEGTHNAVFAPLGAVQAPKSRRSKAKPAEAPAAAPA